MAHVVLGLGRELAQFNNDSVSGSNTYRAHINRGLLLQHNCVYIYMALYICISIQTYIMLFCCLFTIRVGT